MLRVNQIKIPPEYSGKELDRLLREKVSALLRIPERDIRQTEILRRSVDARKKPEIYYIYSVRISAGNEEKILRRFRGKENIVCRDETAVYRFPEPGEAFGPSPVIVGAGPAGLFCGYFLALRGCRPVLLERGKPVEQRQKDVEEFWETGRLNAGSNVQFGEGGAGAFSDGKLNTLVKDGNGRNRAVLETFVKFGAKESILYDGKPHLGTDVLCRIIKSMRQEILRLGGQVRFESRVTDICVEQGRIAGVVLEQGERIACRQLVLAVGHSARDTFCMLREKGVPMEAKAFAVGLRVEHLQSLINESQYGRTEPGSLGAAPYKVTAKTKKGRGVYSFCMCPGGYVVNASSEEGHLAVNGMSYSGRNGKNANSAVVVTVTPEDFGLQDPLAGIGFQRELERRAYQAGQGKIPVQRYGDYKRCVERKRAERDAAKEGNISGKKAAAEGSAVLAEGVWGEQEGRLQPQCKGEFRWADVSGILPDECNESILEGMEVFGRQIAGFDKPEVCLSGVESRTSSPVRILRDDSLQSEIRGLYPCGEGAGYAGGIMSAAMDGLRVAEQIAGCRGI